MVVIRALAALCAGLALALGALGLASQQSLDSGTRFAQSMTTALADPSMRSEVRAAVRDEVRDGVQRAAAEGGAIGTLIGGLSADTLADQAAEGVDSARFTEAWHDWALLVHGGLASHARGDSDPDVSVTGDELAIAIEPLAAPLAGDALAGGITEALDLFDRNTTVTIATGFDLDSTLTLAGRLAELRWVFLGLALALLLIAVAGGRRRAMWAAITLTWGALLCAGLALAAAAARTAPGDAEGLPETGGAIIAALTQGWPALFLQVSVAAAVAAIACGIVAIVGAGRRDSVAATRAAQ